jgi:NAD(P)-dependent dehydrogenase (short-subunit alcohol dehydrogenase family)
MPTSWIYSISSDIGAALAERRLDRGDRVAGTYRSESEATRALAKRGAQLTALDLEDPASVEAATLELRERSGPFDECIVAPGTLEPIGMFAETKWQDWNASWRINFLGQLEAVHAALPHRRPNALILFFAGGGTNGAPTRVSAYTASKIALIKMTELLQAEIPDARCCILGPGWVDTKIHQEMLRAGERAAEHLQATRDRLGSGDCVAMTEVLDCIDWIASQPADVIGGRNLSVAHDDWRAPDFTDRLRGEADVARLRRHANHLLNRKSARD